MKHHIVRNILITVLASLVLVLPVTAFATPKARPLTVTPKLNNIALCYHGIVTDPSQKSEYMSYIADFKEQINYIKSKGYTFVAPSKYNQWYTKKYTPTTPIATIMFDDARASVDIASSWLIENKIPFGIAVIGRRLNSIEPDEGYMKWPTLKAIYDSGYCEILSHSYNMHHFDLINENGTVTSAPIMEGPAYVDNGNFPYMDSGDTRWYWDLSRVDQAAWAFPLLGTDTATGQPITSTLQIKAQQTVTVNKIRVWATLHLPNGSGYNTNVKIAINGTEVANKTVSVQQYETRSQWPEREFVTIDLDKAYAVEANKTYTVTFTTQNTGSSIFQIYSIPDFSGDNILSTTATGMTYNANEQWPAKPCIILAGDNGKSATDSEFQQYIFDDLNTNNNVIKKYLSASWNANTTGYTDNASLETLVLGGTYSDGKVADTAIKFTPDKSFTGEVLKLKTASHTGAWYPLVIDIYVNDVKVARYLPNWNDWTWQTVSITPYQFVSGQEYNISFKTLNKSTSGTGLVRILADQQDLPWPAWDSAAGGWIQPDPSKFQYKPQFQVAELEGSDVYPSGIDIQGLDYSWKYTAPYTGPGKAFMEFLSCTPGTVIAPTQICYPFGSYYAKANSRKEDLNPAMKAALQKLSMTSGYAVWDEGITSMANIQSNYSEYVIPRYLVLGNLDESQILKNIDILIGQQ